MVSISKEEARSALGTLFLRFRVEGLAYCRGVKGVLTGPPRAVRSASAKFRAHRSRCHKSHHLGTCATEIHPWSEPLGTRIYRGLKN